MVEETKKAPTCMAFAKELKEVFGDVKLERAREGDTVLGKTHEVVCATCMYGKGGKPLKELYGK